MPLAIRTSFIKDDEVRRSEELFESYSSGGRTTWAQRAQKDNDFRHGKQWTAEQLAAITTTGAGGTTGRTFATGVYKPTDVCGECHGEIEDFNDIKAFLHATIIYIFAFVLAGGALLTFGALPNLSEKYGSIASTTRGSIP